MIISTTWHGDNFNVDLASAEGKEAFLSIKGCRIANGSDGAFVSWPATKNEKSGKWWRHVWGSDKFNATVLEKALASRPQSTPSRGRAKSDEDDSIPF